MFGGFRFKGERKDCRHDSWGQLWAQAEDRGLFNPKQKAYLGGSPGVFYLCYCASMTCLKSPHEPFGVTGAGRFSGTPNRKPHPPASSQRRPCNDIPTTQRFKSRLVTKECQTPAPTSGTQTTLSLKGLMPRMQESPNMNTQPAKLWGGAWDTRLGPEKPKPQTRHPKVQNSKSNIRKWGLGVCWVLQNHSSPK